MQEKIAQVLQFQILMKKRSVLLMSNSYIADSIVNEYNRKQYYAKKRREKCKNIKCTECKYIDICTESEKNEEEEKI